MQLKQQLIQKILEVEEFWKRLVSKKLGQWKSTLFLKASGLTVCFIGKFCKCTNCYIQTLVFLI